MSGLYKFIVSFFLLAGVIGCSFEGAQSDAGKPNLNKLSQQQVDDGWILMFDGSSASGWRGYGKSSLPAGWVIDDQALHFTGGKMLSEEQQKQRGDIVFDQEFSNFTLQLEWKISQGGNSGIFYLGKESEEHKFIWQSAPEMQVLDNLAHPDANKGKNGNRQAGSLYDLIPATPQNAKTVGQWNSVEITVKDRHVTHIQNGQVVVEYQLDMPQWQNMVATSKFPGLNENWVNVAQKGLIGLQDHDDPVWFRNIKIKPL